ncbi:MAG TPA: GerAB/ArcD/ProY family transporter, partial [Chondromyces sp.]|nr:GerAB/ArcD/ProY family transporter [Chondromyces sp.]
YHQLYRYYPDILPTEYMEKIIGKVPGRVLAFLYILYFLYIGARVLRDFGSFLIIIFYTQMPLVIANALLITVIIYAVRKGIEVLARTGEMLIALMYLLAISGFILVLVSGLFQMNNLKPVLENGLMPVLKSAVTQTWYVPFGEAVVFAMLLPYLNHPKRAKAAALSAIALSGVNLTIVMAINMGVLGLDLVVRSLFPLLTTIQAINLTGFLNRLDVYFMLALILGGFFKIGIFIYAAVSGTATLFQVKKPVKLVLPFGFIVLVLSIIIAGDFGEHAKEGLELVPLVVHLPFQVIIPTFLLVIAFLRNRKRKD